VSVEELKAVVDRASEEERLFLAAYLRVKSDDGSLRASVTEANQRMDAGKSVSLDKVKDILGQLDKLEQ
jgi:hypothetical protein